MRAQVVRTTFTGGPVDPNGEGREVVLFWMPISEGKNAIIIPEEYGSIYIAQEERLHDSAAILGEVDIPYELYVRILNLIKAQEAVHEVGEDLFELMASAYSHCTKCRDTRFVPVETTRGEGYIPCSACAVAL